jgi:hypothetical protein
MACENVGFYSSRLKTLIKYIAISLHMDYRVALHLGMSSGMPDVGTRLLADHRSPKQQCRRVFCRQDPFSPYVQLCVAS